MKKFLIGFLLIVLTGCSLNMKSSPKQKVEDYLNNYKNESSSVIDQLKDTVEAAFDNEDYRGRYKTLMINQYKEMKYKVTDEVIEDNTAVVEVEITVLDYGSAITKAEEYYKENKDEFTKDDKIDNDKYDDYRLTLMEKVKDTINYKIEFNLTKDDNGEWQIDNLSDDTIEKLHGIYVE